MEIVEFFEILLLCNENAIYKLVSQVNYKSTDLKGIKHFESIVIKNLNFPNLFTHLIHIIFGYLISTKFLFKIFFFFLFFSFQNSKFYFYHRHNYHKFSSRSSSCTCNYINVQKHRTVIVN